MLVLHQTEIMRGAEVLYIDKCKVHKHNDLLHACHRLCIINDEDYHLSARAGLPFSESIVPRRLSDNAADVSRPTQAQTFMHETTRGITVASFQLVESQMCDIPHNNRHDH